MLTHLKDAKVESELDEGRNDKIEVQHKPGVYTVKGIKKTVIPPKDLYSRASRWGWGKSKVGRAAGTLWVVIPFVILCEMAITFPLEVINPDHPPRLAFFCTACSLDAGQDLTDLSVITTSVERCIKDQLLYVIGDMFVGYIHTYLGTMVGHILVSYTLLATQDGQVSTLPSGRREMLHSAGYGVLVLDMIVEVILLARIRAHDPADISLDGYSECGTETHEMLSEEKEYLVDIGTIVFWLRLVVGTIVACIFVYKAPVEDFDPDSDSDGDSDDEEAAKKKG